MQKIVLEILKIYTKGISPILHRLSISGNHTCRFSPTCSEYTAICIEKYGVLKGIYYGSKQLANCHSFTFSFK